MKYFYVPEAVSLIAEQGLDLRREQDGCICKTGGTQIANSLSGGYVPYSTIQKILAFFNRSSDDTTIDSILLRGGNVGYEWVKSIIKQEEAVEVGSFVELVLFPPTLIKKVPSKYLTGAPYGTKGKREKEIKDRKDDKTTDYKPLPGDEKKPTKESKYSKTTFANKVREEMKDSSTAEFLRASSKISKIPKSILREVHRRGAEAWATSGHRVGASQIAWSRARVYSFVTGGKTRSTADKDLWEKYKAKKKD
jgi:hypothetical protein